MKIQKCQTAVVISDIHIPFQDDDCLRIVEQVIKRLQPDKIIVNGDLLDCYSISHFLKDPSRITSLQDELNQAKVVLKRLADASPKSQKILLAGNHEQRLEKVICSLEGPARELAKLDTIKQALTWPNLLGLKDTGWQFVPVEKQPSITVIPEMAIKHGTIVRKFSGYSERGEFEQYGMNGSSGHTHRLGTYYHRTIRGQFVWAGSGCLCSLNPDYVVTPNWQQGFLVVTWDQRKQPVVETIHIVDGTTIFRGQRYSAA